MHRPVIETCTGADRRAKRAQAIRSMDTPRSCQHPANREAAAMSAIVDEFEVAEGRLRTIVSLEEELRETREQLESALQREEALRAQLQWRWRQRLRRACGVRLGIMRQYRPRP